MRTFNGSWAWFSRAVNLTAPWADTAAQNRGLHRNTEHPRLSRSSRDTDGRRGTVGSRLIFQGQYPVRLRSPAPRFCARDSEGRSQPCRVTVSILPGKTWHVPNSRLVETSEEYELPFAAGGMRRRAGRWRRIGGLKDEGLADAAERCRRRQTNLRRKDILEP